MSTPDQGWNDNQPPPPPPPPGPPGPPPYGQGQPATTSLPLWSLIVGIAALVLCFANVILGIVAIILGVMGRKKAKELGQSTGMATGGIVTGAIAVIWGIIWYIIFFVAIIGVGGVLAEQFTTAEELDEASVAAERYFLVNSTYAGLTTEALTTYGYTPNSDVIVEAMPTSNGSAYCIQGAPRTDPGNVIHVPPNPGNALTITVNGKTVEYSMGRC